MSAVAVGGPGGVAGGKRGRDSFQVREGAGLAPSSLYPSLPAPPARPAHWGRETGRPSARGPSFWCVLRRGLVPRRLSVGARGWELPVHPGGVYLPPDTSRILPPRLPQQWRWPLSSRVLPPTRQLLQNGGTPSGATVHPGDLPEADVPSMHVRRIPVTGPPHGPEARRQGPTQGRLELPAGIDFSPGVPQRSGRWSGASG